MTTWMSPNQEPLVSVIIPTHNRAHTLPRAIRSVLAQTHENLELIVADDASSDTTPELLAEITDPRLRYVRHDTNRGPGAARNLGMVHATGEFIAFQDSDDEWLLDKLAFQLKAIRAAGDGYGATFGGKLIYGRNPAGRFGEGLTDYRPRRVNDIISGDITSQLVVDNLISPQTLLLRASIAHAIGNFDERLPNNEDWEFMLRMSIKTKVLFTNRPVAVTHISADSISRDLHRKARSFMAITRKHEALFRENPRNYSQKLFVTARHLYQLGRYRPAREFLRRALRLYPWSVKSWLRYFQASMRGIRPFRRLRRARFGGAMWRNGFRRPWHEIRLRTPDRTSYRSVTFPANKPARHAQRADSP